ncbi:MAG TPA: hypothetical protein VK154_10235 [Chitinophagales bacterium]|nr:hypothetical protein [Chitinophagales bacterium]
MSVILTAACSHNLDMSNLAGAARQSYSLLNSLAFIKQNKNYFHRGAGGWRYRIDNDSTDNDDKGYIPLPDIYFENDRSTFSLTFYPHCVEIGTGYRYWNIYKDQQPEWFNDFRRELRDIINLFGATEVIYLPDNAHFLEIYFDKVSGLSYNQLKQIMQVELGDPVTDFAKLDVKLHRQYFLDTFSDM